MATDEDRTPLFAVIGIYLFCLFGVAFYSFVKGRSAVLNTASADAEVDEHFLASRSFGVIVLFLTTFSTIISGYTAFSIPQETSGLGFISFRWLQGFVAIIIGYALLAPRYRRLAIYRHWQSPNDIVADKFNCNSLRLLAAFAQCAPMILYIAVQFISLEALVFQLSLTKIDGEAGVWFLVIFIWICEVIGGFRGVSLTDAIQSGIMLFAFMGIPFLLLGLYGGFEGINGFPLCENFDPDTSSGCLQTSSFFFNFYPPRGESDVLKGGWQDYNGVAFGGNPNPFTPTTLAICGSLAPLFDFALNDENFTTGPPLNLTSDDITPCVRPFRSAVGIDAEPSFDYVPLGMLSFSIALSVSGLQPHWAQRIISARSDVVVKRSLMMTAAGIFFASLPGLMLGLTKVAIDPEVSDDRIDQALPIMLGVFYDLGGVPAFFSVVISVAGVAAFMSTADSAAIGVSNVITIEVFQNFLTPNMTPATKIFVAKIISLITLVSSRMLLYLGDSFDPLTALNWQIGLGWAVMPTYVFALYGNDKLASGYSLIAGMVAHYILLLILEWGLIDLGTNIFLYSGIYCGALNFIVTIGVHLLLPDGWKDDANRSDSDSVVIPARERFGGGKVDHLTADKVTEIMSGTTEPISNLLGGTCIAFAIILLVCSFPWYGEEGWDSSINGFDEDALVVGLPQWVLNLTLMAAAEFVLLLIAFSTWKVEYLPNANVVAGSKLAGDDVKVLDDVEEVEDDVKAKSKEDDVKTEDDDVKAEDDV